MRSAPVAQHCVVTPFYGRFQGVARGLTGLLESAPATAHFLLVDDGSPTPARDAPEIARLLSDRRVTLLRHDVNRGVAAARNTAIDWCRRRGIEIAIMIDSDCEAFSDFVHEHLRLHEEHPAAAIIGGAVVGVGEGFWAGLDNVMTWVHSMPLGGLRRVEFPYHLPSTNFSLKIAKLPKREVVFDERLCTGEDALLVRELRARGEPILFSPTPRLLHYDRDTPLGVLDHHYRYGHHQYFVQLGNHISARCFALPYRIAFFLAFALCLPLFALAGSIVNLLPWLPHRPHYVLYYPLMYGLWLSKGIAILEASVRPAAVLRRGRSRDPERSVESAAPAPAGLEHAVAGNGAPPAPHGSDEAEHYRRLEREWQDDVGYALLDKPYERRGSAAVFERQFDRLIALMNRVPNGVVIEVGCGKGHFLQRLRASGAAPRTLVGLDLSRAVESLPEKGILGVQADGERLPFRDASASHVVYDGSLHHCIDYPSALREAVRVLAPGGSLVLFEPVSSRFSQLVHKLLDPIVFQSAVTYESPIDIRYKRAFRQDVVRRVLDEQGLEVREKRSDFLAYPFTGCAAGSFFTRSERFMHWLMAAEEWAEAVPLLGRVAGSFAWRFTIVATKPAPPAAAEG